MKREANFQEIFGQYIQKKGLIGNFELKQTMENSINWNDARLMRQCESLLAAESKGYYWKHSDADPREKLFDCSNIPPIAGFVVIKYPKLFCIIPVKDFMDEKGRSERSSLTSERAIEIARVVVR